MLGRIARALRARRSRPSQRLATRPLIGSWAPDPYGRAWSPTARAACVARSLPLRSARELFPARGLRSRFEMAAHAPEKVPCGPEWGGERRTSIPRGPGVAVVGGRIRY